MNDKVSLRIAKQLKKDVQKGFGKRVCTELCFDCANCQAQALVGYLNWYINLLEWSIEQDGNRGRKKQSEHGLLQKRIKPH
ncbi:MAG: hypothetical protein HYT39_02535 [Candidatus Sungbacteria bacterium]|nr:hypothetical protein [Candidatus Sungbacteria bacterium]